MIQDVRTVLWKEARSLFRQPGSKVRTVLTVVSRSGSSASSPRCRKARDSRPARCHGSSR